jgi:hypothetical protein
LAILVVSDTFSSVDVVVLFPPQAQKNKARTIKGQESVRIIFFCMNLLFK